MSETFSIGVTPFASMPRKHTMHARRILKPLPGCGVFFSFWKAIRSRRREAAFSFKFFLFTLLRTLLHEQKLNSFVFRQFRTLCPKTVGAAMQGGHNRGIPEKSLYFGPYPTGKGAFVPVEAMCGGGRLERRRCPCGEAHPGNTSCGERPTPRCLRGFPSSAK